MDLVGGLRDERRPFLRSDNSLAIFLFSEHGSESRENLVLRPFVFLGELRNELGGFQSIKVLELVLNDNTNVLGLLFGLFNKQF